MNTNFKIIYMILKTLRDTMDRSTVDTDLISPEAFGITQEHFNKLLRMMCRAGYVTGLSEVNTLNTSDIMYERMELTIDGLEYLENNNMMKKVFYTMKGIKETVPML